MRALGLKILSMAKAMRNSPMELYTRVHMLTGNHKAMALTPGKMGKPMRVSGLMVIRVDQGFGEVQMVTPTSENGKMGKRMVMESIRG